MKEYSPETIELLAEIAKQHDAPYTAEYIQKYGPNEPLYGVIFTESDTRKSEERAKQCIEAGKTATELGLPMKFEGVRHGS